MDRELGQKRGNGQHDGQHGRYMYEKKGIWLEGSVLTGRSGSRLTESLNAFSATPRRNVTSPLRYAQQINSGVAERPKPEA